MNSSPADCSFALFPFLKTTSPVQLGKYIFRPTEDHTDLTPEQINRLKEIMQMLFLRDDLQITAASYAKIPFVMMDYPTGTRKLLRDLEVIQAVIAYIYASPHPVLGMSFLEFEDASMAVLSPGRVSQFTVRPDHPILKPLDSAVALEPDDMDFVPGYNGVYNFRHYFWLAKGSRLYPPIPNVTLNLSQNLAHDVPQFAQDPSVFSGILGLLFKPLSKRTEQVLTAIQWFNASNSANSDEQSSIVNLAIAFEALLGLPEGEKKDRFIDAVSLLLGRVPRLQVWAAQFYKARSEIVHEGRTNSLNFIATDSVKIVGSASPDMLHRPLLSFGRQVFQLCVATLLAGASLADRADLEEKLITNQERFVQLCKILSDGSVQADVRLTQSEPILVAADEYGTIGESNLRIDTMLGVMRLAAAALLECDPAVSDEFKQALEKLQLSPVPFNALTELNALYEFHQQANRVRRSVSEFDPLSPRGTVIRLSNTLWQSCRLGMHYWYLRQEQEKRQAEKQSS